MSYSLRTNPSFCFEEEELKRIEQIAEKVITNLKENDLTYIQAVEVLETCKAKIQMCLIS